MKKQLITALIAGFILMFASCKKDYTCTCNYIDNTGAYQTKAFPEKSTKTTARTDCDNRARELTYSGRSVSCSL